MFSGPRREGDLGDALGVLGQAAGLKLLGLSLDKVLGAHWDLLDPLVSATLLRLRSEGFVDFIMGGPPCVTHSVLRFIDLGYAGAPQPLRFRARWE